MKRMGLLLAFVALSVVLLSGIPGSAPRVALAAPSKPNIVFILADDMRKDDLRYMPKTRSLLKNKGMTFENAYVSNPLCCPARATIMKGQYAHNTGVWSNGRSDGGWRAFARSGGEKANVATSLDRDYRTALIGKYFNGYNKSNTYVPPGWDRWFATSSFRYFNYFVNDDRRIRRFGNKKSDYQTDVLKRQTSAFIGTSAARGTPFFAYVAPIAPHGPATPAPRDARTHQRAKAPRPPSFNEKDVSDKPPWIKTRSRLTAGRIARIDRFHRKRAESLQALDDLVAEVVGKLNRAGVMSNTYVFFTSDNGWAQGEHRRERGKAQPYEEDVRVPLLVRGPGVAAGSTTRKLALNTDYLPTFTDLAGVQNPGYVDGRSLRPVLKGDATRWRDAILLEGRQGPWSEAAASFSGIRTSSGRKYVVYANGFRELYDLNSDPFELRNLHGNARSNSYLASRLRRLENCSGYGCRAAEDK